MAIAKCVFCGKEQEDYKGVYFIKNDGSVNYYSSSKCLKNHLKLRRDKRKVRWTESFHEQRRKHAESRKVLEETAKTQKQAKKIKSLEN